MNEFPEWIGKMIRAEMDKCYDTDNAPFMYSSDGANAYLNGKLAGLLFALELSQCESPDVTDGYASDRVFNGTRPLSADRVAKLRAKL